MFYCIWLIVSLLLPFYGVIRFWPPATFNDEFILFNDICTVLTFAPLFFILFLSVSSQTIFLLFKKYELESLVKIGLLFYPLSIGLYSFIVIERWPLPVTIVVAVVGSAVGITHLLLTTWIRQMGQARRH
ncbi:hypothetical protein BEP19_02830 [Ammoniphilus oxalaticus]|uniref:Uncharacterized protein n=1 Tax=Ammoniphilus oxalaticus TaxID=66863 RepID=A0A419SNP7_9BACL|nr:hypothetical protein [Ammoniphilus oxalaticus]RKD25883.1 hypothetical protein BEP19_02830 [Ammoniphilus oxalaticus]